MPEYSAVGTIIEGPSEYYSARLSRQERKESFVSEAMEVESREGRLADRYGQLQTRKRSGKKGFYRALQARRKGKFQKR